MLRDYNGLVPLRHAIHQLQALRFEYSCGDFHLSALANYDHSYMTILRLACQCPGPRVVDELGYLPIDKLGADLLFQVFSARYERGSIILTTNKAFKHWPSVFNNDATLASAILDRILHHSQAVIIEGPSYRTKHRIEDPS